MRARPRPFPRRTHPTDSSPASRLVTMCKLLAYCEQCLTSEITTSARVCRYPDRSGKPCTSRPVLVSQDIFRRDGYTPQSQRNPLLCKTCRHLPHPPEPRRDPPVHHYPPKSPSPIVESVSIKSHHSATRPQTSLSSKHPPFRGHPSISGYVSSRSSVHTQTSAGKVEPEVSYQTHDPHRVVSASSSTRSSRDSQHRDISSATAGPRYAVQNSREIPPYSTSWGRFSPSPTFSSYSVRPYPFAPGSPRQTSHDSRISPEQGPSRRPGIPMNPPNIPSSASSVAPSPVPTISPVGSPEPESRRAYPSRREAWSPPTRSHTP